MHALLKSLAPADFASPGPVLGKGGFVRNLQMFFFYPPVSLWSGISQQVAETEKK